MIVDVQHPDQIRRLHHELYGAGGFLRPDEHLARGLGAPLAAADRDDPHVGGDACGKNRRVVHDIAHHAVGLGPEAQRQAQVVGPVDLLARTEKDIRRIVIDELPATPLDPCERRPGRDVVHPVREERLPVERRHGPERRHDIRARIRPHRRRALRPAEEAAAEIIERALARARLADERVRIEPHEQHLVVVVARPADRRPLPGRVGVPGLCARGIAETAPRAPRPVDVEA